MKIGIEKATKNGYNGIKEFSKGVIHELGH